MLRKKKQSFNTVERGLALAKSNVLFAYAQVLESLRELENSILLKNDKLESAYSYQKTVDLVAYQSTSQFINQLLVKVAAEQEIIEAKKKHLETLENELATVERKIRLTQAKTEKCYLGMNKELAKKEFKKLSLLQSSTNI